MTDAARNTCPACGSKQMYTTRTSANGGYGPTLLPRLGRLFQPAKFDVYLCGNCGHTAFYATEETLDNLDREGEGKWRRVF